MTKGFPLQDTGPGMNELFHDLQVEEEIAEEFDLPSYKEPGRILFQLYGNTEIWLCKVEIIDYDSDKATFWLNEGGFMDFAVADMIHLELDGYYVLEGVVGHAWQDDFGEYDEEWSFEFCRRATEEEIRTEALEDICINQQTTKREG